MMIENLKGHLRGILDIDRPDVGETPRYVIEELFRRPLLERLLARVPLVVVETAHQERQLCAEMDRKPDLEAIAQRVQNGAQHVPRDLSVGPELGHDLVEPDVGGLQGLVENVETGGAHVSPPMIAPRFWTGNAWCRLQFRRVDAVFGRCRNVPASGEAG